MTLDELKSTWPDYAKDIKLNLSQVLSEDGTPELTPQQRYGVALSVALTVNNGSLVDMINTEAGDNLNEKYVQAIKSAVSIMGMNNIYYRFVHLANDEEIKSLPAKLRMMVIGNPGIDKKDFEMFSLAISAITGCGMCIESHTAHLIKAGVSKEAIQSAIRIAAVIHGASKTLAMEAQLQHA